jgi:small GTP-binding protein
VHYGVSLNLPRVPLCPCADPHSHSHPSITPCTHRSANIVGTVGVNFKTKKVAVNGEQMQVQVWDTAGQEHFHKITTSYYRGAHGIMLVYDVADSKTMDNAEYW